MVHITLSMENAGYGQVHDLMLKKKKKWKKNSHGQTFKALCPIFVTHDLAFFFFFVFVFVFGKI